MVHNCPEVSSSRTSLYPTAVKVMTVMYRASVKLHPSNTIYPNAPVAVMITSARTALSIRRKATRGSYTVLWETARLSRSLRSPSAMDSFIARQSAFLWLKAIRLTKAGCPLAPAPPRRGTTRRYGAAVVVCP